MANFDDTLGSTIERGVLHHPTDKLVKRDAGMLRHLRHE